MEPRSTTEYWLELFKRADLIPMAPLYPPEEAAKPRGPLGERPSFIAELQEQHPEDSLEVNSARGLARFICHKHPQPVAPLPPPVNIPSFTIPQAVRFGSPPIGQEPVPWPLEPDPPAPPPVQPRSHWRWIDAAILAAILLLFGAKLAHCQFYGPLTVQSNGSTVALFSSVGTLNFTGSGTPCTASGITVTCDLASSSAGVTSVGLTMPAQFTVTGSPVTSTGTLAASWATVAANLTFAGPASGSAAAPTFRALVAADIPTGIPIANIGSAGLSGTSPIAISSAGAISCSTCLTGSTFVSSFTGDGTVFSNSASTGAVTAALATHAANLVFAGPSSGVAATPTFRALVGADLPAPSATTLGGVESIAAVAHNFLTAISTLGVPAHAQPACADLSDAGTGCSGTAMTYPGAGIPNSTGSAWGTSYATTGSGSVVLATSPTLVTPALGTPSALVLTNATGEPTSIDLTNATSGKLPIAAINATGTASSTTYLRGDGSWSTPSGGGGLSPYVFAQTSVQAGDSVTVSSAIYYTFATTYTFAAGTFCGTGVHGYTITDAGSFSETGGSGPYMQLNLTSTELTGMTPYLGVTATGRAWSTTATILCVTTGSSGSVEAHGQWWMGIVAGNQSSVVFTDIANAANTATFAVDTTAAQTIEVEINGAGFTGSAVQRGLTITQF